jgi:hypothetical protein
MRQKLFYNSLFILQLHLDEFAQQTGGKSWKQWAKDDPMNWQLKFIEVMNNTNNIILFNLDDVEIWEGITRASRGNGGATDWELLQIYQNKSGVNV